MTTNTPDHSGKPASAATKEAETFQLQLNLNGQPVSVSCRPDTRLLTLLREHWLLTGAKLASIGEAVAVARQLRGRGPDTIIITSLATPDIPADQLGTLAVNGAGAWLVTTPRIDLHPLPNGGVLGVLCASIGSIMVNEAIKLITGIGEPLLGRLMDGKTLPQALELATATLYSLVKSTTPSSRDLPLIGEQMQLVEPAAHFAAQAITA